MKAAGMPAMTKVSQLCVEAIKKQKQKVEWDQEVHPYTQHTHILTFSSCCCCFTLQCQPSLAQPQSHSFKFSLKHLNICKKKKVPKIHLSTHFVRLDSQMSPEIIQNLYFGNPKIVFDLCVVLLHQVLVHLVRLPLFCCLFLFLFVFFKFTQHN